MSKWVSMVSVVPTVPLMDTDNTKGITHALLVIIHFLTHIKGSIIVT